MLVPSTIKYTDYKVVIDNVTYYPGITAVDTKNKTSISNAQFFDEHGDIFLSVITQFYAYHFRASFVNFTVPENFENIKLTFF